MTVLVDIAAAVICFGGICHPALIGTTTPRGEYTLELVQTKQPNYGGTILKFKETKSYIFAVHRTWPGREAKYILASDQRRRITKGCINVEPAIYRALVECCSGASITIQ